MRVAVVVDPRAVVEADGLHHKRVVVFPSPDRIAVPARIGILRQRSAIGPDHPMALLEHVQHQHLVGRLGDLHGAELERDDARKPCRIAERR